MEVEDGLLMYPSVVVDRLEVSTVVANVEISDVIEFSMFGNVILGGHVNIVWSGLGKVGTRT